MTKEGKIEKGVKSHESQENEKINFELGENLGIRIKGHSNLKDDYEYCNIKLFGNNRLEFRKEAETIKKIFERPVGWKLTRLLDEGGNDEDIENIASQYVVLGYEMMHSDHLRHFLGFSRIGSVSKDKNGKEIKDPCGYTDELLKKSKKPYSEYLRMINFAEATCHMSIPETIIKSNDSETLKKFLDYSLRVMVKSEHNRSDALLKRLAQDSELLNLIDPLLKEYALPMLIQRDFSELWDSRNSWSNEEVMKETEKKANELRKKLGIAKP